MLWVNRDLLHIWSKLIPIILCVPFFTGIFNFYHEFQLLHMPITSPKPCVDMKNNHGLVHAPCSLALKTTLTHNPIKVLWHRLFTKVILINVSSAIWRLFTDNLIQSFSSSFILLWASTRLVPFIKAEYCCMIYALCIKSFIALLWSNASYLKAHPLKRGTPFYEPHYEH